MNTRTLTCLTHGGTFQAPIRRGRPPTGCKPDSPCSAAKARKAADSISVVRDGSGKVTGLQGPSRVERVASAIKNRKAEVRTLESMSLGELQQYAIQIGLSTGTRGSRAVLLRNIREWQTRKAEQKSAKGAYVAQLEECDHSNARAIHARCPDCGNPMVPAPKNPRGIGKTTIAFNDGSQPSVAEMSHHAECNGPHLSGGECIVSDPRYTRKLAESASEPRSFAQGTSPSLTAAKAAKERLESLGWTVDGRATGNQATLTAVRGEELLTMTWQNGTLVKQDYTLWNVDIPKRNNKPESKLGFDPDEVPDKELVRILSGMKVTWWNSLGQKEETGVIPVDRTVEDDKAKGGSRHIPAQIRISHMYTGTGDEQPSDRIVTFNDFGGNGSRSFRVGALLKIG